MTIAYDLHMERGPTPGIDFPLHDRSLTVGRDPYADIVINDPEVSRQHALLISVSLGEYRIQDLGSTNGTFVNGKRLDDEPASLRPSDVITLGGAVAFVLRATEVIPKPTSDNEDVIVAMQDGVSPEESAAIEDIELSEEKEETELLPAADQPPAELPTMDPVREPKLLRTPEATQSTPTLQNDKPTELSPKLILGSALLLLCCCMSLLFFLIYLGGDWYLRQLGLVP